MRRREARESPACPSFTVSQLAHITPASFSCSRRATYTALTDTDQSHHTPPGSTPGLNPCNHLAWQACGPWRTHRHNTYIEQNNRFTGKVFISTPEDTGQAHTQMKLQHRSRAPGPPYNSRFTQSWSQCTRGFLGIHIGRVCKHARVVAVGQGLVQYHCNSIEFGNFFE